MILNTWSSLRAVRPTGWKLGQVRVDRLCYIIKLYMVSGFRFQVSAQPLATETARLIEDETSLEPKKAKMGMWERFATAINSVWYIHINEVSHELPEGREQMS